MCVYNTYRLWLLPIAPLWLWSASENHCNCRESKASGAGKVAGQLNEKAGVSMKLISPANLPNIVGTPITVFANKLCV